MKTKNSSLTQSSAVPAVVDTNSFGQVFLLKGNALTLEPGIPEKAQPLLVPFKSRDEMQKIILANRPVLFGKETIGLTAKIGSMTFPFDAFLFDFSDREDPRCFLLMTPNGITVSMLALIAIRSYLQAIGNRTVLLQMLAEHVRNDKASQEIFESFLLEGQTIQAMIEYAISKRLRALFITNEIDQENVKLFKSYVEAHSELLDLVELRKYKVGKGYMLSMVPAFADLKEKEEVKVVTPKVKIIHTEDHHFSKGSTIVRSIYEKLKAEILKIDKSIVFNAKGRYYISLKKGSGKNLAFFHFRKTSMYLVVMLEEKLVRKMVKKAEIKTLPPSVQSFWNGASTGLVISSTEHLKEIAEVLKKVIKP